MKFHDIFCATIAKTVHYVIVRVSIAPIFLSTKILKNREIFIIYICSYPPGTHCLT